MVDKLSQYPGKFAAAAFEYAFSGGVQYGGGGSCGGIDCSVGGMQQQKVAPTVLHEVIVKRRNASVSAVAVPKKAASALGKHCAELSIAQYIAPRCGRWKTGNQIAVGCKAAEAVMKKSCGQAVRRQRAPVTA